MIDRLVSALAPHVPPAWAQEIAKNVAGWLPEDHTYEQVYAAITHRMEHFGMPCRYPSSAALAASSALAYAAHRAWYEGSTRGMR